MKYSDQIREFVIMNYLYGDSTNLQDDTSFLDSGTIDSTGMLELIMFLETTFTVKVAPEEMVPENLDSINRVANFISRKVASSAVAGIAA